MVKKVLKYFVLEDNYLCLSEPIEQIAQKENLTNHEIIIISEIIEKQHQDYDNRDVQTRVHIYENYLCITYLDLVDFFGVAGGVTAGGVMAFLTAIGSVMPGVGNIIGSVLGLFGGAYLASKVAEAILEKKGIAFSIIPLEVVLFQGQHPGKG